MQVLTVALQRVRSASLERRPLEDRPLEVIRTLVVTLSGDVIPKMAPGNAAPWNVALQNRAPWPGDWGRGGRRWGLGIVGAIGLGTIVACGAPQPGPAGELGSGGGSPEDDRPAVVATSTILADLTATIAGETIDLTGLLQPGADPHVYEPVPQDSRALEQADLIIYNGHNLEPGLIKLIGSAGVEAEKLAAGEQMPPLDFEYQGQREPDPHVWGDVANTVIMVEAIEAALVDLVPDQAAVLRANGAQLRAELTQLDRWIETQIATIPEPQRRLVTTHDAFQYYAQAYGLSVVGTLIGMSTEEQPSAQTVQRLVEAVKAAAVPAIFAETTLNPQLIRTVAEEAGVILAPEELYSDSLGAVGSGAETYGAMMEANTRSIVENLGGEFVPFQATAPDR
ncbi:MAG: metal ABC transporter solute-binding protein, Zn/Mn family [Prochlorothrix sp.]